MRHWLGFTSYQGGKGMNAEKLNIDPGLEKLQRETFGYFLHEAMNGSSPGAFGHWPLATIAIAIAAEAARAAISLSRMRSGFCCVR